MTVSVQHSVIHSILKQGSSEKKKKKKTNPSAHMETEKERPVTLSSSQASQDIPLRPSKEMSPPSSTQDSQETHIHEVPANNDDTGISPAKDSEQDYKALSETKPPWAVFLVVLGILMSLFLVALDRTIVSTVRIGCSKPMWAECLCSGLTWARQSPRSPMISTRSTTSGGTVAHTCCHAARFSSCSANFSSSFPLDIRSL